MRVKIFTRLALILLLTFCAARLIFCGESGIINYIRLKREILIEQNKKNKLEVKILKIKKEIKDWLNDDFELEKVARQDLQMGMKEETIYLLV